MIMGRTKKSRREWVIQNMRTKKTDVYPNYYYAKLDARDREPKEGKLEVHKVYGGYKIFTPEEWRIWKEQK